MSIEKKSPIEFFFEEYKAATHITRNIYIFICVSSFFILIAMFNFRFSWLNSEDNMAFNRTRDYWFSPLKNSTDTREKNEQCKVCCGIVDNSKSSSVKVTLIAKDDAYSESTNISLDDEYFKERFFEKRYLDAASSQSDIFEDKRMFLNMESLGVYIYVQDIPLLGGFVVSLLFLWFIFARNNELELLNELENELKEESDKEKARLYSKGIRFATIFKRSYGRKKTRTPIFLSMLLRLARSLFLFIFLMLAFTFVLDVWESHVTGPDFQKYVKAKIDDGSGNNKIVVVGRRCNYLLEKIKVDHPSDFVHENVPVFKLVKETMPYPKAKKIIRQRVLFEIITGLLLVVIFVEILVIQKIFRRDEKVRKAVTKIE